MEGKFTPFTPLPHHPNMAMDINIQSREMTGKIKPISKTIYLFIYALYLLTRSSFNFFLFVP